MRLPSIRFLAAPLAMCLLLSTARAFPPEPDGLVYGMVKDQYGTPLLVSADQVILQTPAGVQVVANIQPGLAIGVNYALNVPMDAGLTPDPYVANALTAGTQYKLYVVVGTKTNLPIEMVPAYAVLGTPAQQTQQNLTLGTDANSDGIPDAWENVFLAEIGTNISLGNINTNADYAHDGRTLRQEYLLGNYPFNPTDVFNVQLISQNQGSAVLGFTTMLGRSYTASGSANLINWTTLSFTIPALGTNIAAQASYYSPDIRPLQIQTVQPATGPQMHFFRLQLQ